ncbi:hypothetical protein CBL_12209 [Carabus blaptoides fortunei]
MSTINSVFFSKELTCLPSLLDKYIGKYYNNALGNTITWGFFIWFIVHFIFDRFVNVVLKQIKYPEYLRCRIASTLWNFGFSAGSFLYCYATLSRNNVGILNYHTKIQANGTDIVTGHYVFGFMILSTFYGQSCFWEATQNGCLFKTLEYASFILLASLIYLARHVELLFVLIYINSLMQCVLELSRTFSFQMYNKSFMNGISTIYFISHILVSVSFYLIVIPLYIIIPLVKHLVTRLTIEVLVMNLAMYVWLALNIYNSALSKAIKHYIWHTARDSTLCGMGLLECSMFPARTDTAFTVTKLRKEIEERRDMLRKQRNKPKAALYQTLKCMVTVRRRIKQRRESQPDVQSEQYGIVRDILHEIVENVATRSENCVTTTNVPHEMVIDQ